MEYLKRLLEYGADPDSADYDFRTALHIAAAEGYFLVAKLLVDYGANVLFADRWGHTAIDEVTTLNPVLTAGDCSTCCLFWTTLLADNNSFTALIADTPPLTR